MGKRGPQRQPARLRMLHGESRPSRIGHGEPVPRPADPEPPTWFDGRHRGEWDRITGELRPMGLLHSADRDVLVALVLAVVRLEDAAKSLASDGLLVEGRDGGKVRNPAVLIAQGAADNVRRLSREFGLTPSGRADLRQPGREPPSRSRPERLLSWPDS